MPSDDTPTRRVDPDDYVTRAGLGAGAKVFGRYRLESLVGRGGMGVVWKARDERLERLVALKILPEVVAGDPEAVRDLLRETKRCLELTHPNIVRVHDLVQDGSLAAISMEYVDGESLANRKAASPGGCLTLGELRPLTAQLCAALDYAHGVAKVVHRDLKPANLLLTRDGQLKVTDFGIARSLSDTRTRLTGRVSGTSGTLLYMSPQQLLGGDPSPGDDIYALGATLYELLTGKPPFHTGDLPSQIRDVAPKPVNARLAALGRDPVPAAWEETIQACLAKEPQDRPQSASEVARRLGVGPELAPVQAAGTSPLGDRSAAIHARPTKSRMSRVLPVAGLSVLALGILAYAFWARKELPRTELLPEITLQFDPSTARRVMEFDEAKAKADKGDAEAQDDLAWAYATGNGVPKDSAAALKWYRKAADQGNADAQSRLGLMYANGDGVPKDSAEAARWYRKSSDQGVLPAQFKLGLMYANGDGVPKDEIEALAWMSVAAASGNDNAMKNRDTLERRLGSQRSLAAQRRSKEILKGIETAKTHQAGSAASSALAPLPREFTITVDPAEAGARLWLGPLSDVAVKEGRAVLKDLPDGEQELTVQASGYQPFTTRVMVKDGRGSVEAKLVPVRGAVEIMARPGTQVTAVDGRGRETRLGAVPASGALAVENLLTIGRYTLRLEHADCAPVTMPGVELVLGRTIKVAPAQTPLPGELRVFSVPTDAEVRVNGAVAGTTPATIKNQPSEQALRLEVFLHGYRRVEQAVTLKPKEVRTLNVGTLSAESGGVDIQLANRDFRMDQAEVRVDGKAMTVAKPKGGYFLPDSAHSVWRVEGLDVGSRTVEITHPDYEPWRQTVTVRDQEMTAVNVELKPKPGTVACETTPAGARVVINGGDQHDTMFIDNRTKAESLTPLRGALPPGTYTLRFELKGYKPATRTVTVAANRTVEASAALEKLRGAEEGQAWTVPDLNLEMAYIRPGTFTMGSPSSEEGRFDNESPQTRVTLTKGYWLGKTEVTQGQWEAVMGSNPSNFKGADRPVEDVSWTEAMEFCRKLTERERTAGRLPKGYEYTLPTEAQWEYACRAGTTGPYAGDGNLNDMGWYGENSGNTTHPVGQKRANAWGLCDMHGNVWEWCLDWYGNHAGGSVRDPTGPSSGAGRVGRGGGGYLGPRYCRSAVRSGGFPGFRGNGLGFRLALAPTR